MMNTRPRTALITGGSSGIGAACALRLAEDDYRVLITGRNEKRLKQSSTRHDNIDSVVADVTEPKDIESMIKAVESRLGHLDVLINNAGIAPRIGFEATTPEDFDNVFDVNVRALLAVSQACLPLLKESMGTIINVSSIAGNRPGAPMFIYSASKAAVDNMTRAMAQELIAYGIRVNAVSPGPIRTPIFDKWGLSEEEKNATTEEIASEVPMARFGEAPEAANVIAFLASSQASYVTGANYVVDGGLLA